METLEIALAVFYVPTLIKGKPAKGASNYRLLLEDRRSHSKYGEEWGFFGGKKEEQDKSIEATLKREVKEELGIELSRFLYFKRYEWNPDGKTKAVEHHYLAELPQYLLEGNELKSETIRGTEGTSRVKLFGISEAKTLKLMEPHYRLLNDLEAYLNR